jgi:ribulose-5-phosphate 4-epimerase/fuculose-1-phosphate aldolase
MTIYLQTAKRATGDVPVTDAERKARVELAATYRIFDMLGWVEMIFNHITVRVPGPEHHFLINPFGLRYHEVTASNLLLTHTTSGMAVASLENGLSPDNFYGAMLHGQVAYHEFEGITVEEGERERLVKSIGAKQAVILRNHGLLAWGPSVPEALMMLWTLQRACDVQVAAAAAGQVHPINPEVFPQTVREGGPAEKRTCDDMFAALQRMVDARDPSYRN